MQTVLAKASKIAKRVRELRSEYANLVSKAALTVKEIGGLLSEAREIIPKKQWAKWLLSELDLSRDAAFRYITIYKNWSKIENHEKFGSLNIEQMFDVARDKEIRNRNYKIVGKSLDCILDIFEQRIGDAVLSHPEIPELAVIMSQLELWRPYLVKAGLLKKT